MQMLRVLAIVVSILAAYPAAAAGLSVDSSQNGSAAGAAAIASNPLSTTNSGDIIVACFEAEWPTAVGAISGVTGTAGLTWTKRFATTMHGGRANAFNDGPS
jgi:hypothetical protein